jgi:hypothetical protein
MADKSVEDRDPGSERSGQPPRHGERRRLERQSDRRRMLATGLLGAPVVMTLGARAARAQAPIGSCQASLNANPIQSHPCIPPTTTTTTPH